MGQSNQARRGVSVRLIFTFRSCGLTVWPGWVTARQWAAARSSAGQRVGEVDQILEGEVAVADDVDERFVLDEGHGPVRALGWLDERRRLTPHGTDRCLGG